MKSRLSDWIAIGAAVGLAGFGAFAWSRRVDAPSAERYGRDQRTLLALEHRLTGEVLKSRSRSVGHYDGIVQSEAAIQRLHADLRKVPNFVSARGRTELTDQVAASERVWRDAVQAVERFKRENAVLRNSLRYLPIAAAELDAHFATVPDGADVRQQAATLVRDALLLQGWNDPALLARITQATDQLASASASAPSPGDALLKTLVAHARVVRERTPSVNDVTRAIIGLPIVARTETMMSTFARHQQAALDATRKDASILFALALAMLLSAATSIILRLRRSADALRASGAELAQAVTSLRAEQEKQKELAELKSRFVSMTSHEFRTPLSVIVSSSEMVEAYGERWPAEKKAEHLGRIRGAAKAMTRMLDAILLIGRSDAGMLKFEPHPLDADRLFRDVIEDAEQGARQAHRVAYRAPTDGLRVVADEALLRHILENLLSNALKYSPAEAPVQFDAAQQNGTLVLTVRDRGIGIPESDRRRLFETFHRGANVGSVAGTGLGLAIVKRAADLHGGQVSVESEVGAGTCFTVRLACPRVQA